MKKGHPEGQPNNFRVMQGTSLYLELYLYRLLVIAVFVLVSLTFDVINFLT